MNPRPVDVKPLDDYKLLVTFQNGEIRVFDTKPFLGLPLYRPLQNKAFFGLAKADGMCVYWNDSVDICPDTLYAQSRPYNT